RLGKNQHNQAILPVLHLPPRELIETHYGVVPMHSRWERDPAYPLSRYGGRLSRLVRCRRPVWRLFAIREAPIFERATRPNSPAHQTMLGVIMLQLEGGERTAGTQSSRYKSRWSARTSPRVSTPARPCRTESRALCTWPLQRRRTSGPHQRGIPS